MKNILILSLLCVFVAKAFAQKETFDVTTYTAPKKWKKQGTEDAVQFTKEDAAKGIYCIITLYKSVPGTPSSKENFDLAWTSVVKEMVNVITAPEMQPSAKEDEWDVESGYAAFELDGEKGVAILVTSTGYNKMVNLIILTNTNAYETEMTSFIESISLKKQTQAINNASDDEKENIQPAPGAKNDGFTFTISNFDDGWNSTVQEDWVEITKGNIKVLMHYPKEGTIFPADPEPLTVAAWNILVAPRYSDLKNFKTAYISRVYSGTPYLGMGYATDNTSGKQVFILLFMQGTTGWLEFVTPDKNSFIQQYKFDPETIRWDSEFDLLNPLIQMTNYNKFAIAAADFTGEWSSDFSGVQQLYNVYTGNYAGMNLSQSNETFQFAAGNNYNWKLIAVNGMVGNTQFAQVKSAGKFTVLNNWQVKFSDIEKKPKIYNAYFSCIKGARLLHLLDAQFPGTGIYTVYGKK